MIHKIVSKLSAVLLFSLLFGYQNSNGEELSEFEVMLSGFSQCHFKDVYINIVSNEPEHSYFKSRHLKPSKIDGEFAYFILDENFHGISVSQIMIPASTFDVHALYLKENISTVKTKLNQYFLNGFESAEEDLGFKPDLSVDPTRDDWSILSCSEREGGI